MQEKQGVFRLRHGGPPSSCRAAGCFPGRADGWSLFGRNVSGRGAGPARPHGTRAGGAYIILKILNKTPLLNLNDENQDKDSMKQYIIFSKR